MEDSPPSPSSNHHPGSLIHKHVGRRLRERRIASGLSVHILAQQLGVSAEDVDAWENGDRRVPASYLLATSTLLSCSLTEFFEGFHVAADLDDDVEMSESDVKRLFNRYPDVKH